MSTKTTTKTIEKLRKIVLLGSNTRTQKKIIARKLANLKNKITNYGQDMSVWDELPDVIENTIIDILYDDYIHQMEGGYNSPIFQ